MNDPLKRAIRTFLQAFIGVFLAATVSANTGIADMPDTGLLKRALLAEVWSGIVAVLSWLQNALEDSGRLQPLAK